VLGLQEVLQGGSARDVLQIISFRDSAGHKRGKAFVGEKLVIDWHLVYSWFRWSWPANVFTCQAQPFMQDLPGAAIYAGL